MLSCCFTGHRRISAEQKRLLIKQLDVLLDKLLLRGVTRFICGGALGFDTLCAQVVLQKKRQNPAITLTLALPCKDQCARWTPQQKREYHTILSAADEVIYLSQRYLPGCMHARDVFMVDAADIVVAHYRGTPGGTQYTYQYAEKKGLEIINL